MKKLTLAILFLFVVFKLSAQFRSTEWGMNKETIKNLEKTEMVEDSGKGLVYKGEIAGLDCHIVYFFSNNQLYQAGYILAEKHSNDNEHIRDFEKLKDLLTKKYDDPDIDKIHWKNPLFKDEKSSWGMAISIGQLVYLCQWRTENTEITLSLTGDNYNINHVLIYRDIALSEKQDQIKEEETLDQL